MVALTRKLILLKVSGYILQFLLRSFTVYDNFSRIIASSVKECQAYREHESLDRIIDPVKWKSILVQPQLLPLFQFLRLLLCWYDDLFFDRGD